MRTIDVQLAMLGPVVGLVGWTLVMLAWGIAMCLPAMRAAGIDLRTLVGTKGSDADRSLPAAVQWKVHNYDHLPDQPTLFYAICGVLALAGGTTGDAALAWVYVAVRIAHSLVQATVNRVRPRFILFAVSSVVLAVLTVRSAWMLA